MTLSARIFSCGAAGLVIGLGVFWILTLPAVVSASALPPYAPNLDNGRTMFNIGGCASCHASANKDPDKVDRTRLGGGLALNSAFGTFFAPNISPDMKDGIGGWSEANFVTAMWKGTSERDTNLYPAFPYTSYRLMVLSDVRDLFAYLRTLPPVAVRSRRHELSFPFNERRLLGRVEAVVPPWRTIRAGSLQIGAMESRRLSGERARTLRRMPQPPQRARRHHRRSAICRRTITGR